MTCVTNGSLQIPRHQFNLESGQIKFSLQMKDPAWEPRLGTEKWDAMSRTLAEVEQSEDIGFYSNMLFFLFKLEFMLKLYRKKTY